MGQTITVAPNQSTADVIIQAMGSMEAGMQFCRENGISISDVPAVGTTFAVADVSDLTDGGVLKYFSDNGIVIGTLNANPPASPLSLDILLKPVLSFSATPGIVIGTSGYYSFELLQDATNFVHANPLAFYGSSNDVNYAGETGWSTGVSPFATPELTGSSPAVTHLVYHVPVLPLAEISLMCWWYNPGSPPPSWAVGPGITFLDSAHNSAFYSPLLIMDVASNTVRQALCADLQVTFISSTATTCTLQLQRTHPPISPSGPAADFAALLLNWILPPGISPVMTSDPNIINVTVAAGTYTFGVESTYSQPGTGTIWPKSACTQVVQIS